MSTITLLFLILIGLAAGLLSGFIGVGGGIIIIPLLMILLGMTQHQAQGTSLAVMLPPIGILAAWNYHKAGFVDWKYALIISAAFIVGGYLSSKLAVNVDAKTLKKVFGIILNEHFYCFIKGLTGIYIFECRGKQFIVTIKQFLKKHVPVIN